MSTVAAKPITPDEFLEMRDEAKGYELIDGQMVEKPVSKESVRVALRIGSRLDVYCEVWGGWAYGPDLGYQCFPNKPNQVRKADASFISMVRMPAETYTDEGFCSTCPELVVEVLSPNDLAYEVEAKRDEWLDAGVTEVWLVYPEQRTVRIHRADSGYAFLRAADTLTTPLLPGFAVPVADLFRRPSAPPAPPVS